MTWVTTDPLSHLIKEEFLAGLLEHWVKAERDLVYIHYVLHHDQAPIWFEAARFFRNSLTYHFSALGLSSVKKDHADKG